MIQNFSYITPVPQAKELIDIALSKTNRGTPSEIHANYQISRIRNFYLKKIKFCAEQFSTRLDNIIKQFPVLEDLHPFYADLINILYNKDHFKISLGQLNTCKHRIDSICKEYCRLLKFGDSLYRCKELKISAFGRIASNVKKLSEPLSYLEEVRQNISRLPSIDTSSRTILICGYPNVGKSSFMNKVSKAHVDVQPYAFTTKNIYVGHFDYQDLKWQVLDTPGIFDQPLESRNSVEMLTITALAHLNTAVLFFIDLSEKCGFSIENQISLYENLSPLLNSKILIVLTKADLKKLEDEPEDSEIRSFLNNKNFIQISTELNQNIELARNTICDMLLSERIKDKEDRVGNFVHRIKPHIPKEMNQKCKDNHFGTYPFIGLPEVESYYTEYKYDIIPEIYNGKNVMDFVNSNIENEFAQILEQENQFVEKRFDILDREQREILEECNNARLAACMKKIFSKRSTIPKAWTTKFDENGAIIPSIVPTLPKIVKELNTDINKKRVRIYGSNKKHLDMKPKHLYRQVSRKHGKISR